MPTADQYAADHTSPLDGLLQEIIDFTEKNHPKAHMLSGHVQGQLLRQLSLMLQPQRILEIGTFTGFSALCMAEGLAKDGLLYTLELREEDAATAQAFFDRSPYGPQIKLLVGDANVSLATLEPETWDLIFLDADKTGYTRYYEQLIPALRPGGILLADNVLFHGEVLNEPLKGKNAIAIAAFNRHVKNDSRVEQVLLTVRDGLLMVRKN